MDVGALSGIVMLVTTVPITFIVGVLAWRNRSLPGARSFLVIVLLASWWSVAAAIELLVRLLEAKLFWSNLQYVSIALLPVAWLAMTVEYTGHRSWMNRRRLAALCLMPIITNVLLWTDHHHHLMRAASWLDTAGTYPVVGRTWGAWFWVHTGYSYALLVVAVALIIRSVFSVSSWYRRRPLALLIATCIPIAASLVETAVPSSSPADDLTPAALTLAALILAWELLNVRLFSLVPVARHALVENMRDGVLVLDDSERVIDLNASAQTLIGQPASQILGRPLADSWQVWQQIAAPYAAGASQAELHLASDGGKRHYEARWSPLTRREQVVARLLVLSDVTERVLLEDGLRDQALTDGLTGLPNRALFMAKLSDAIRQARRREEVLFAVMVLDLDRFKLINDNLGHLAGDLLLQSVAAKLRRCVREADTVARMGGDEFIILLHEVSSQRDLLPVLHRIREELQTPVYFKKQQMTAASSVGVVMWDPSYEDPDEMVRAADTAMYQAKEDGRDCHRFFDENMHTAVIRTHDAETDLRAAIKERAFSLIYQPIVDLKTGSLCALEGLLRWQHPERGTIFPHDFLTVAENSGLIVALGEIALDEVCNQLSSWQSPAQRVARLPVSVNVSPRQLIEPDFVPSVLSRLAQWRIPSDRLVLEITENALLRDPPKARQAMRRLRGLGVRLCLDDFGAGGCSLKHLSTFPVQELKIDPSFISAIAPDNKELEVVRCLTGLAHALGLEVTAEGVERPEQWELAKEAGCDRAQGYYIGSPMEPDVLPAFLEDLEQKQGAPPKARAHRGARARPG
jgi:diguanylate cyclase (GGDEF)-like protein/PAS domain S-box-containing protein